MVVGFGGVECNLSELVLWPVPTDGAGDSIDGVVTIVEMPRIDMTIVRQPTETEADGEVASLPASADWVHELWAVVYDIDDNHRIDFGDLAFLAPNFGKSRSAVQAGHATLVFPPNFPDSWRVQQPSDAEGEGWASVSQLG